ncbi:Protoporphyrinogen oxidase [Periconia macrospinosa]|uniref:Protoporphyrinogen oxidase n=1 Tax=Periconia macrospinosa TaxID=97972 RepID=A0A2V1DU73_9PLEO|nr:Protoporphyrinogen oxidase [Periconia macrospinosa]
MAMRLKRHVSLFESSIRRATVPTVANSLCTRCRRYASSAAYPENIAVLGGGISGLASAYFVAQEFPRSKITIYEAEKQLGGWIRSQRIPVPGGDVLFEHGPRTLRPGRDSLVTQKLIQELDLVGDVLATPKKAPGAANRYVYYPDRLNLMPGPGARPSYFDLAKSGVFAGWHNILAEPFQSRRDGSIRDESVGSFLSRRVDKRIAQNLVSAIFHGIYAGDVWKLSAKTLLGTAWQLEMKGNSVWDGWMNIQGTNGKGTDTLISPHHLDVRARVNQEIKVDSALSDALRDCSVFTFKNGLQQLVDALSQCLKTYSQIEVKLGTPVESYNLLSNGEKQVEVTTKDGKPQNYDLVISTLRAPALTPYVTVMTVNLYYSTPNLNPVKGFGYLIPQGVPFEQNPERALGVTFDSDAVQGQDSAPGTKLTVMLGGHWWDEWDTYPDSQEGLELAKSLVKRHLGITEEPTRSNVGVWKDCIPQYTVGYEDRLRDYVEKTKNQFGGRVKLVGNQYNGVAVNNCIEQAWMMARGLRHNGWKEKATGLESRVVDEPWSIIPVNQP